MPDLKPSPWAHKIWPCLIYSLVLLVLITATVGMAVGRKNLAETHSTTKVNQPHIVVMKSQRILHLFDGEDLVRSYPIELGSSPVGPKRFKDDGKTPEGVFHIVTKNPNSDYGRFLGINYPDPDTIEWGRRTGLISIGETIALSEAWTNARKPSWTTVLGGGIGLHGGGGKGQDWTAGCVAVADEHIEELYEVLRIGDTVEILP